VGKVEADCYPVQIFVSVAYFDTRGNTECTGHRFPVSFSVADD
jgi:hypothetical protein